MALNDFTNIEFFLGGTSFGQNQSGFMNPNPANWNQNIPQQTQQTSNFGVGNIQQYPGFGFGGQPNPMQGLNSNQGLNNNFGFNNQGFKANPGFNNNQHNPGGFNKQVM